MDDMEDIEYTDIALYFIEYINSHKYTISKNNKTLNSDEIEKLCDDFGNYESRKRNEAEYANLNPEMAAFKYNMLTSEWKFNGSISKFQYGKPEEHYGSLYTTKPPKDMVLFGNNNEEFILAKNDEKLASILSIPIKAAVDNDLELYVCMDKSTDNSYAICLKTMKTIPAC